MDILNPQGQTLWTLPGSPFWPPGSRPLYTQLPPWCRRWCSGDGVAASRFHATCLAGNRPEFFGVPEHGPNPLGPHAATIPCPRLRSYHHPPGATSHRTSGRRLPAGGGSLDTPWFSSHPCRGACEFSGTRFPGVSAARNAASTPG
jgi:hypothetical protein